MQSSFSTATITDGPSSSLHSSPSIAGRNFFARKPKACPGKQRFYDCKHKNKHFKGCCPVNPCASAVCPGKKVNAIRVRDSAPKSDVGSPLQFSPYTSYVQVGTGSSSDSSPVTVTSDDPTSTSSSTDSPSSSNSGQGSSSISGGAAAGIGVGCAVGVALLVLAGVLLYKHRKKNVAAGILAGSRYPLDAPPPYQQGEDFFFERDIVHGLSLIILSCLQQTPQNYHRIIDQANFQELKHQQNFRPSWHQQNFPLIQQRSKCHQKSPRQAHSHE